MATSHTDHIDHIDHIDHTMSMASVRAGLSRVCPGQRARASRTLGTRAACPA